MDDAAEVIQHSWRAGRRLQRNRKIVNATLLIQRCWRGAIQRKWLRKTHKAATYVQKFVRGLLVRVALDKPGRQILKKFKEEADRLTARRSELTESQFLAKRASIMGKSRVALAKHRDRVLDLRRMSLSHKKSRHVRQLERENRNQLKGTVQPVRTSVFEPMVFAMRRLIAIKPSRYGTKKSTILEQIQNSKRAIDKDMPKEETRPAHAAARRGRAVIAARRLARRPKRSHNEDKLINSKSYNLWSAIALSAQ